MINFYKLTPGTNHRCDRCANFSRVRILLRTYSRCRIHKDVNLNENYNAMRPNDCTDWSEKKGDDK